MDWKYRFLLLLAHQHLAQRVLEHVRRRRWPGSRHLSRCEHIAKVKRACCCTKREEGRSYGVAWKEGLYT